MGASAVSAAPECVAAPGFFERFKSVRRNPRARSLIRRGFSWLQERGINVTPCHFYWPIPRLKELALSAWPRVQHESRLDYRVAEQKEMLRSLAADYAPEMGFAENASCPGWEYHRNNGLFETVDADIAYALMRRRKPRRIVEVGSGFSTRLLASAVRRNTAEGAPCELVSIDPFPDAVLCGGIDGLSNVLRMPVQQAPETVFDALEAGDVLFIDSSHVVGVGSDVVRLVLDVLPRLHRGVLVHLHDIFLPENYPPEMVFDSLCFWSEQYLLEAFLLFNREFRIVWSASLMQSAAVREIEAAIPQWRHSWSRLSPQNRQFIPTADRQHVWPSSFWMERV